MGEKNEVGSPYEDLMKFSKTIIPEFLTGSTWSWWQLFALRQATMCLSYGVATHRVPLGASLTVWLTGRVS